MIPTFLGQPFYNSGFPVPATNIYQEGISVEEMKLKYFEGKATPAELEILKEYVLYYVGAPVFEFPFDTREQEENFKTKMSLDDILDLLLDAGIDPL